MPIRHRKTIDPGTHERDLLALRHGLNLTIFRKTVTRLTNRSHDIRDHRRARGIPLSRHDLMIGNLQRRAQKIVHRRIDHQKVLRSPSFQILPSR